MNNFKWLEPRLNINANLDNCENLQMVTSLHNILFLYQGMNKIYKALLYIKTTVAWSQGQKRQSIKIEIHNHN